MLRPPRTNFIGLTLLIFVAIVLFIAVLFSIQQESTPTLKRLTWGNKIDNRRKQSTFRILSHGRYLTNCRHYFDGRIGNHLFKLAGLLYIAKVTKRQFFLTQYVNDDAMNYNFDRWFDVERSVAVIKRVNENGNLTSLIGSFVDISFTGRDSSFDESSMDALRNRLAVEGDLAEITTVRLRKGYFASWRYVDAISNILKQMLRPKLEVITRVEEYFESIRPKNWVNYIRIGLHVRAGDFRAPLNQMLGFTVPTQAYFKRALRHVIYDHKYVDAASEETANLRLIRRFQIIVATDEFRWTSQQINVTQIMADLEADHMWWSSDGKSHSLVHVEVDVVYSVAHDAGFDLVALSMCDAIIISTGTYGWWAGWLSGREVTYFRNWPRAGANHISSMFSPQDFFPPSWNGIEASYFDFNSTGSLLGGRLDFTLKLFGVRKVKQKPSLLVG